MNRNVADYDYDYQDDDTYRDFPNISLILILSIFLIVLICIGIYVHNKYSPKVVTDDEETISIHLTEELFSSEKTYQPEICIICLEEFNLDKSITTLECNHSYHLECIKDWFKNKKMTCPCCKENILI